MERRFTPGTIELRDAAQDGDAPHIEGYAAVYYDGTERTEYELWPGLRERIMPGAFDRVLAEGQDVRGLFNHDPNNVLGRTSANTMDLRLDARGLPYDIAVPDTTVGRDLLTSIKRSDVTGSSFSFLVAPGGQRFKDVGETTIREITEFDAVFDVGPVTFPAYTATTTGARGVGELDELRESLDAWRSAKALRRQRIAIRAALIQKDLTRRGR